MSVLRDDFKSKDAKPYKIEINYGVRMNATNTDSFLRTFITCLEEAIIAREIFINYFKSNDNWSEEQIIKFIDTIPLVQILFIQWVKLFNNKEF